MDMLSKLNALTCLSDWSVGTGTNLVRQQSPTTISRYLNPDPPATSQHDGDDNNSGSQDSLSHPTEEKILWPDQITARIPVKILIGLFIGIIILSILVAIGNWIRLGMPIGKRKSPKQRPGRQRAREDEQQ